MLLFKWRCWYSSSVSGMNNNNNTNNVKITSVPRYGNKTGILRHRRFWYRHDYGTKRIVHPFGGQDNSKCHWGKGWVGLPTQKEPFACHWLRLGGPLNHSGCSSEEKNLPDGCRYIREWLKYKWHIRTKLIAVRIRHWLQTGRIAGDLHMSKYLMTLSY